MAVCEVLCTGTQSTSSRRRTKSFMLMSASASWSVSLAPAGMVTLLRLAAHFPTAPCPYAWRRGSDDEVE